MESERLSSQQSTGHCLHPPHYIPKRTGTASELGWIAALGAEHVFPPEPSRRAELRGAGETDCGVTLGTQVSSPLTRGRQAPSYPENSGIRLGPELPTLSEPPQQ